ncbi:unnamed protein product, partial [marine sediment metagenome]
LFLMQAPLSLQEEEKEDTILMNGQEILISGQQMSHGNQRGIIKRLVAVEYKLGVLTVALEELTEKVAAQHKEEQKLLRVCTINQAQILSYQLQLKKDRKAESRDIKIAIRETAKLLKEFKEVYEK